MKLTAILIVLLSLHFIEIFELFFLLECKDKNTMLCKRMHKKLGDRACHHKWFTDRNGKYGCEAFCNCCYDKDCHCNDRFPEKCKKHIRHRHHKDCKKHWFITYVGEYGCRESCKYCSKKRHWKWKLYYLWLEIKISVIVTIRIAKNIGT